MKKNEEHENENLSKEHEKYNNIHEQVKALQQRNADLDDDNCYLQGKVSLLLECLIRAFKKMKFLKSQSKV